MVIIRPPKERASVTMPMVIPAIASPLPFWLLSAFSFLKKVIPNIIAKMLVNILNAGNQKNKDDIMDALE